MADDKHALGATDKHADIGTAPVLYSNHDAESGYDHQKERTILHASDLVTENEERDLRRGLAQRHVSMIALAGELRRRGTVPSYY
jgi:amino acid permease